MPKQHISIFDNVDIPTLMLIGAAVPFFIIGFSELTAGALHAWVYAEGLFPDPLEEPVKYHQIAGIVSLSLSGIILLITYLYWVFIPKRLGVLRPELTGFGSLLSLMAVWNLAPSATYIVNQITKILVL